MMEHVDPAVRTRVMRVISAMEEYSQDCYGDDIAKRAREQLEGITRSGVPYLEGGRGKAVSIEWYVKQIERIMDDLDLQVYQRFVLRGENPYKPREDTSPEREGPQSTGPLDLDQLADKADDHFPFGYNSAADMAPGKPDARSYEPTPNQRADGTYDSPLAEPAFNPVFRELTGDIPDDLYNLEAPDEGDEFDAFGLDSPEFDEDEFNGLFKAFLESPEDVAIDGERSHENLQDNALRDNELVRFEDDLSSETVHPEDVWSFPTSPFSEGEREDDGYIGQANNDVTEICGEGKSGEDGASDEEENGRSSPMNFLYEDKLSRQRLSRLQSQLRFFVHDGEEDSVIQKACYLLHHMRHKDIPELDEFRKYGDPFEYLECMEEYLIGMEEELERLRNGGRSV